MDKQFFRVFLNMKDLLKKVNVTGIDEANNLTECGVMIDAIINGDVKVTPPAQPSAQPTEDSGDQ